ncbi:DEAD/DEAH box helicase [Dietzia sp.]|uniref:DEAD/DEAH box helicase n=1 Tax=Dietzia sp. TaxID=1871616 RepID=UPI002FD953D2
MTTPDPSTQDKRNSLANRPAPLTFGRELLDEVLRVARPAHTDPVTFVAELPPQVATFSDWPEWTLPELRAHLADSGVARPYSHQVATAEAAHAGEHVVVSTGTASGKSLGYQLPALSDLARFPRATALYLAPTKALGQDQLESLVQLVDAVPALRDIAPATYDGDTPPEARRFIREHSRWIVSNPDMLHLSILGRHAAWTRLLRNLRYVIVDECHSYRGVFGSNVALILRRLDRLARALGACPTFVLASATTSDPGEAASRLVGHPVSAVTEDGSPQGGRTVALWEPGLVPGSVGEQGAPVRRAAASDAARIMASLLRQGAHTISFVRSRAGAESLALRTKGLLSDAGGRVAPDGEGAGAGGAADPWGSDPGGPEPGASDPWGSDPLDLGLGAKEAADLAGRVAAYRAGYLASERRAIEKALGDGTIMGVASTSALELGVDISGLDAVISAGFPGTRASFWQQAGRAGRRGQGSLVVLVARDDPLDTYLVHHPEALLGKPVEATVTDPTNPVLLDGQLRCAVSEYPMTHADAEAWGAVPVLESLAERGLVRRRRAGWYPGVDEGDPHPEVDIRGTGGAQVAIVDGTSGKILGSIDTGRARTQVHPGALYLHMGESFVVDELDLVDNVAIVRPEDPGWSTSAREKVSLDLVAELEKLDAGPVQAALCEVEVTTQVVEFERRDRYGQVLEVAPLDLPPQTLFTKAVMYTVSPALLRAAGIAEADVPGSLHAAEHAAIGLLPLVATCDRWDIGGLSTDLHPDTGLPTVFVYDGYAGGAGFAERGFRRLAAWLSATRAAIESCECESGCPSCVQSPKCGNGNNPLDKAGAVRLLVEVAGCLSAAGAE